MNDAKIRDAVKELLGDLLLLQAEGDYEGVEKLIETYGEMPEKMKKVIAKLGHVPVDIKPVFEIQGRL